MPLQISGQVGSQSAADGSWPYVRQGREGDVIVSELHGRYYEKTVRSGTFSLTLTTTSSTIAAGNINAAAAAASTQFALWNPSGSGVNVSLLKVWVVPISGTAPVSGCFHNLMLAGVPTIASVGTAYNNLAGTYTGKARFVSSAAGTALTGGGAIVVARPMAMTIFAGALAATTNIQPTVEVLDGDIVLPPGTGWVPCWTAAGTTFLNGYGVSWEEVAI
jgi:hypothetical protein